MPYLWGMDDKTNRPKHDQLIKYLMKDLSFSRGFFDFFLSREDLEKLDMVRLRLTRSYPNIVFGAKK